MFLQIYAKPIKVSEIVLFSIHFNCCASALAATSSHSLILQSRQLVCLVLIKTSSFIKKDLAKRISLQSGDLKSSAYPVQKLSRAGQLGNAGSIFGNLGSHPPIL